MKHVKVKTSSIDYPNFKVPNANNLVKIKKILNTLKYIIFFSLVVLFSITDPALLGKGCGA